MKVTLTKRDGIGLDVEKKGEQNGNCDERITSFAKVLIATKMITVQRISLEHLQETNDP